MKRFSILLAIYVTTLSITIFSKPLTSLSMPYLNISNGHYYELVPSSFTKNWIQCNTAAELMQFMGVQGHLATITSQIENDFIRITLAPFSPIGSAFIGGYQNFNSPTYSEPRGGWEWVTGEPFVYTNWNPGEPNNIWGNNPNEDGIEFFFSNGYWNDISRTEIFHPDFIVEFDVSTASVPEPSTFLLLGAGLGGLAIMRRNARKQ